MTTNNSTNNFNSSPLTTKGDLYGYDTGNNRLPVGSNGKMPIADSTQAIGLNYDYPALDISLCVEFFHDLTLSYSTFESGIGSNTSGTGSLATFSNTLITDGTRIGIAELETGSTTTGFASSFKSCYYVNNGQLIFEMPIQLSALSNGTDTYSINIGFTGSTSTTGANNGIYFNYTNGTNSGKFQCVTNSAGSVTTADSGITVAATTWYNLQVIVNNNATSVGFYINHSLVATITTNIPTAQLLNAGAIILKSAGTTNVNLFFDFMSVRKDFTTQR